MASSNEGRQTRKDLRRTAPHIRREGKKDVLRHPAAGERQEAEKRYRLPEKSDPLLGTIFPDGSQEGGRTDGQEPKRARRAFGTEIPLVRGGIFDIIRLPQAV